MVATIVACPHCKGSVVGMLVLLCVCFALAQAREPTPKPPAVQVALDPEQRRINDAIDRGTKFLKTSQFNNGRWDIGAHAVGYAALPGLTLLECGVPASDPAVQRAAKFVRYHAKTLDTTYELSLAILFLDRLGDSHDRDVIQTLAIRLIAGQNTSGGWTYRCLLLGRPDQQGLLTFLRRKQSQAMMQPIQATPEAGPNLLAKSPGKLHDPLPAPRSGQLTNPIQKAVPPETATPVQKPGASPPPGLLMPLDVNPPPPPEKEKPTRTRPAKSDPLPARLKGLAVVRMDAPGFKGNAKAKATLHGGSGDNSNTQFAILALWVARRHGVPMERTLALIDCRFQASQNEDGGWGYHYEGPAAFTKASMTCVGLLGLAVGHGFAQETAATTKKGNDDAKPRQGEQDPAIQRGLKKLGQYIGNPTRSRLAGGPIDLYTLWSIERVGVLYNLKTIGNKDWYAWIAQLLLTNQEANGSWWMRGYTGSSTTIDTCLALLILRRTNLVQDLTESLRLLAITDPDSATRATGGR